MNTKPPLQKILQGILHTEDENKQNHQRTEVNLRRRDKYSGNSIEWAAGTQILKQKNNKMAGTTTYLLILTVDVSEFNSPIKRL
jgi:hypothetical protein